MTGPVPGPGDLHDPARLLEADTSALLPAAALAGAQVRATADQFGDCPRIARPRALVLVGAGAAVDAALLTALIGDQSHVPVIPAATLPPWVGALDVVVVLATTVFDLRAAEAADAATRRGATVFVRAAAEGPVAAAAPRQWPPRIAVTESLAGPARLTMLAAVAAAADLYPLPDFAVVADVLDAMAVACNPRTDFFVNPALTLAEHLAAGVPLLIGTDPVADALAAHGVRALASLAGLPAASLTAADATGAPALIARIAEQAGVFHDPFEDSAPHPRTSVVLLSGASPDRAGAGPGPGNGPFERAVESALPKALRIGQEELPELSRTDRPTPVDQTEREAFGSALALMCRLDFAAVYLALVTGARPPADVPDGLGPAGGAMIRAGAVAARDTSGSAGPGRGETDRTGDTADTTADPERENRSWS